MSTGERTSGDTNSTNCHELTPVDLNSWQFVKFVSGDFVRVHPCPSVLLWSKMLVNRAEILVGTCSTASLPVLVADVPRCVLVRVRVVGRPADWKSAIQQVGNLRCEPAAAARNLSKVARFLRSTLQRSKDGTGFLPEESKSLFGEPGGAPVCLISLRLCPYASWR